MKKNTDVLCIDDDVPFVDEVKKILQQRGMSYDTKSDTIGGVNFLLGEKRRCTCIILDGKFNLWHPSPNMPEELQRLGEIHGTNNPDKLAGLTLLRYIREKKWSHKGVLWILSSNDYNHQLEKELQNWGIEQKLIYSMRNKIDFDTLNQVFDAMRKKK